MSRGVIGWADLGPVTGSAPAKRRPVVVVQSNSFNRSSVGTVIALSLTSNTSLADVPGNVFVPSAASGLAKDSVVVVTRCSTVDRSDVTLNGSLMPAYLMSEIDAGLRLVLDL
ncbi:type II toxin-antitoxin system PemK/MazF family toxin [Subtercola boreus]|nr:type II toxin-antitoxin system PemK/MazF family toxin [Subtercola boreus]